MKIKSFGKIQKSKIQLLEKKIGFKLPVDYALFLENNNGGVIEHYQTFFVKELGQDVILDVLFGIEREHRGLDLSFWFDEKKDDLPEKSLVIGKDPGGNFILLVNSKDNKGIYYWGANGFFLTATSTEEKNTYLIDFSFTKFINELKPFNG